MPDEMYSIILDDLEKFAAIKRYICYALMNLHPQPHG